MVRNQKNGPVFMKVPVFLWIVSKRIVLSAGSLSFLQSLTECEKLFCFTTVVMARLVVINGKTAVKSEEFTADLASVAFGCFEARFGAPHLNQWGRGHV